MPILHSPGVMMPGQFGPMRREELLAMAALTLIISITGMPSVMQMTSSMPASTASRIESAAPAGGTKIIVALQPVSRRASMTVSKTGTLFSKTSPPRVGVTPATTLVPYSIQDFAWVAPDLPVMPCTSRRVFLSTRMDMVKN